MSQSTPDNLKIQKLKTYSADARLEKKNQIRDRAKEMLGSVTLADFSMDALAKLSGVAKGTLYIYFQSKEDVFVSIYLSELQKWADQLNSAKLNIRSASQNLDLVTPMASLFVESFSQFKLMIELSNLICSEICQNISAAAQQDLQMTESKIMSSVANKMSKVFPELNHHQSLEVLRRMMLTKDAVWTHRFRMRSFHLASAESQSEMLQFKNELLQFSIGILRYEISNRVL